MASLPMDFSRPIWRSVLSDDEFSSLSKMFPNKDYNFFFANFTLLEEHILVDGRPVLDPVSENTYRKIQECCFWKGRFVPMLTYNKRFSSNFTIGEVPATPDLTVNALVSSKVLGYREKIDGSLVWASTVTHIVSGISVDCFIGGISFPLVPGIERFELKGALAFSILPFNVKLDLGFLKFEERVVFGSPQSNWEEGAIVITDRDGVIQEYKAKWYPSAEVRIERNRIVDEKRSDYYNVGDGVYEVIWAENSFKIISSRPFKNHDPHFRRIRLLPTPLDCPVVSPLVQSCAPYFSSGLYPRTIDYGRLDVFEAWECHYGFELPKGSKLSLVEEKNVESLDSEEQNLKIRRYFLIEYFSSTGGQISYSGSGALSSAKFTYDTRGVEMIKRFFCGEFYFTGLKKKGTDSFISLGIPVIRFQPEAKFWSYVLLSPMIFSSRGDFFYDPRVSQVIEWEIRKKTGAKPMMGLIGSKDYSVPVGGRVRYAYGEKYGKRMIIYATMSLSKDNLAQLRDRYEFPLIDAEFR